MKHRPFHYSIYAALACAVATLTPAHGQSITNFAAPRLQISGGDANLVDTRSSIYSGWLSIASSGQISGTIVRRNFANGQTNSGANPVLLTIAAGSRVFGPVANDGVITNIETYDAFNSATRVTQFCSADFYVATANPNFFVKGRANLEIATITNIWTQIDYNIPDPQNEGNYINVTNVSTNVWTGNSVSLGGVSFGAVGTPTAPAIRGIFDANSPSD